MLGNSSFSTQYLMDGRLNMLILITRSLMPFLIWLIKFMFLSYLIPVQENSIQKNTVAIFTISLIQIASISIS